MYVMYFKVNDDGLLTREDPTSIAAQLQNICRSVITENQSKQVPVPSTHVGKDIIYLRVTGSMIVWLKERDFTCVVSELL